MVVVSRYICLTYIRFYQHYVFSHIATISSEWCACQLAAQSWCWIISIMWQNTCIICIRRHHGYMDSPRVVDKWIRYSYTWFGSWRRTRMYVLSTVRLRIWNLKLIFFFHLTSIREASKLDARNSGVIPTIQQPWNQPIVMYTTWRTVR